ncbi:Zinc finger ZZ-type and EF-hand domain-containing protein 1 [Fusarium austroafricanum]|uniref:Zinc finger ZZ-type and EF-hand domain-containing protein 1 n=1 Tax=Fusarium austroafricanum TaxID=2364996 RepID=A0A8H4K990_9HYPO|nr:Zinc finger ZZ-type and EF-hand domain-containing protein 1 [Fusarium austroafricanum]
MSFLNKFKKEFEGLNLGGQQPGGAPPASDQTYQAYGNNPYQQQGQQSYGQPPYPGQNQHNTGYQSYNGQPQQSYHERQQYPGKQSHSPQPPPYNPSFQPPQQSQHQQWTPSPAPITSPPGQSVQSPPSAHAPYGAPPAPSGHSFQSPPALITPYNAPPGPGQSGAPCPTPPSWIPYWSEKDRQWYYVETSGRSSWQAPSHLPPLPGMPAFPGSLNTSSRDHQGQSFSHPPQPQYANPQDSRPSLPEKEKKSSSFLAAAGGFAAGGAAGYFIKDRIDKRKSKKRHGKSADDFSDFADYPAWEVGLECNICDQSISGPYAHCKKCDGGDYDICRDCLAQGQVCDGKGKHNMVKVAGLPPTKEEEEGYAPLVYERSTIGKLFRVNSESRKAAMRFYRVHMPCYYHWKDGEIWRKGILFLRPELDTVQLGISKHFALLASDVFTLDSRHVGLVYLAVPPRYSWNSEPKPPESDDELRHLWQLVLSRPRNVILVGRKADSIYRRGHSVLILESMRCWEPRCRVPIPTEVSRFDRLARDLRSLGNDFDQNYVTFSHSDEIKYVGMLSANRHDYREMMDSNPSDLEITTRKDAE